MKNLKKRIVFILLCLNCSLLINAQNGFVWSSLEPIPEKVSNNAVCAAQLGDTHYVYSFAGIDTTKLYSGIHLRSFRYNFEANRWDVIPSLPDTLGKIATAASHVNEKIYITGGYHVLANTNEISSNKIHIYDVASNSFLADGATLPYPIDDHVQAVWRDSLIYVITGWSNNGNYPYVQVYNTFTDSWATGTPTPNTTQFKCFGASGMIIGDTIFYYGGVSGAFSFTAQSYLRKGIIDPQNPLNITWTQLADSPGAAGYRCAPFRYNEQLFWLGGAGIAYNYDGIAYSNGQGVPPLSRIVQYDPETSLWIDHTPTPFDRMDFRGAGEIMPGKVIVCGGMMGNQQVSNSTFLIEMDSVLLGTNEHLSNNSIYIYPNPTSGSIKINSQENYSDYFIYSLQGELVLSGKLYPKEIDLSFLPNGFYVISLWEENKNSNFKILKQD